MSKEKDKILRTLEHIAITFDKFGFSPTIPICTGHKDFNYLFRLEIDTIKELCDQQAQRIAKLEEQLKNAIVPKFKIGQEVFVIIQSAVRKTSINSFRVFENNELSYYCKYVDGERMYLELDENELFATKEEAESKLEELKGE